MVLRYGKVNKAEEEAVVLTGVNPLTGKHVDLVFGDVPAPVLRQLKTRQTLGTFLKVNAEGTGTYKAKRNVAGGTTIQVTPDGRVQRKVEFIEEEAPALRKDSYFTLLTYCHKKGYNPEFLRKLDIQLVTMESPARPTKPMGALLLNMVDKLGNMLYAADRVEELHAHMARKQEEPLFPEVRYQVSSSISSCKSAFDAGAAILNEVYKIGYTKGKVDLSTRKSNLLQRVERMDHEFGARLQRYESWVNNITEYRDYIEHRIMLVAVSSADIDDRTETLEPLTCRIPTRPTSYEDDPARTVDFVEAGAFCRKLVGECEGLVQTIGAKLLEMIEKRRYAP